jgi:hypothetical protein
VSGAWNSDADGACEEGDGERPRLGGGIGAIVGALIAEKGVARLPERHARVRLVRGAKGVVDGARLPGRDVSVLATPAEEVRGVQLLHAIEQRWCDAAAVVRHRGGERQLEVGDERRASAHAVADRRDAAGLHLRLVDEPLVRGTRIRGDGVGGDGVEVRTDCGKVSIHTLDVGAGAMIELGRDDDEALGGEARGDVTDVVVDAVGFLEQDEPGLAAGGDGADDDAVLRRPPWCHRRRRAG